MSSKRETESFPELREYVREYDERLFNFCLYMLGDAAGAGEMVMPIFQEFGKRYRKMAHQRGAVWNPEEVHLVLFRIAWERLRSELGELTYGEPVGRDMRRFQGFDVDLLEAFAQKRTDLEAVRSVTDQLVERLTFIDPDFRAPVVLRDILKLDDEQVMRILGIRWGVYRHRLHRGRLECRDYLRARWNEPRMSRPSPGENQRVW